MAIYNLWLIPLILSQIFSQITENLHFDLRSKSFLIFHGFSWKFDILKFWVFEWKWLHCFWQNRGRILLPLRRWRIQELVWRYLNQLFGKERDQDHTFQKGLLILEGASKFVNFHYRPLHKKWLFILDTWLYAEHFPQTLQSSFSFQYLFSISRYFTHF